MGEYFGIRQCMLVTAKLLKPAGIPKSGSQPQFRGISKFAFKLISKAYHYFDTLTKPEPRCSDRIHIQNWSLSGEAINRGSADSHLTGLVSQKTAPSANSTARALVVNNVIAVVHVSL